MVENLIEQPHTQSSSPNFVKDSIGLVLEVFTLLIIFFFSLGILNYFNIIRLGASFPFLANLPHKMTQTSTVETVFHPVPTTSVAIPSQKHVQYATASISSSLLNYAQEVLQKQYIPASLSAQILTDGVAQSGETIFFDRWEKNNYLFHIQVNYQENTQNMDQFSLLARFEDPHATPSGAPTATETVSLLQQVFQYVPSQTTFSCGEKHIGTASYTSCQSFTSQSLDKVGYGILIIRADHVVGQLFSCKILHSNPYFNDIKTCLGF